MFIINSGDAVGKKVDGVPDEERSQGCLYSDFLLLLKEL